MNTLKLNKSERLALIRFCLNRGTHLKCSTHSLLRPLELHHIEDAFKEWDAKISMRIEKHCKSIENYKNGRPLDSFLQEFLGSERPSVEIVEDYFHRLIKQENDMDIRKSYSVAVDYIFLTEEQLVFHNSMNPKITFGYSSQLHEECDSEITDEVRKRLLPCFCDKRGISEFLTFGGFECGSLMYYEDLIICRDERPLLSTITHENMFDLFFNDEDIAEFRPFENNEGRNEKILGKLQINKR